MHIQRGKYLFLALALGFAPPTLSAQDETTAASDAAVESRLRVALVDVQGLFRTFHKTEEAQSQINAQRSIISKKLDEHRSSISQGEKEALRLLALIRNPETPAEEKEQAQSRLKALGERINTAKVTLSRAYQKESAELDRQMSLKMSGLLSEIQKLVEVHAKESGYDMVVDISGTDTNLVPMMLYARDSENITAILLKELNKNAPNQR